MRDSAFGPIALPDSFWHRPDVSAALTSKDIGELFRLLHVKAKITQTRIGTACDLSQGRISAIIHGKQRVRTLTVYRRVADGLNMPEHARILLGVASEQPATPSGPAAEPPVGDPGPQRELLRQIASARNIDTSIIEILQEETNTIRLLDRRLGAPAVAAKLEAQIAHVSTSLRHTLSPGRRQRLAAVLADAAALAGWQAIDMGRLPAAWNHFETATAAAREADDSCLLAFAAGEQAYVLLDLGQPAEALDKVRAVYEQTHAAIPYQMRGWLRAAEGEMAAAGRKHGDCHRALDLASTELGHGPSGEDLPYLALNDTHLARWRGNCLVHFGDPSTITDLTTALAGMDGTFTRAEAGLRCDLAAALHVSGERDAARGHLARAAELAQLTGSARQRRRIAELARHIGHAA
ncbi:MAG TPA: XRE family transcriptional regulator [Streptosporangiaceae bacterium]|nr:XRE family transcriptional regulator [Streptosporangiaceae bacterium]